MASLFDCVKTFCLAQGLEKTYWVAFSGGLDSHVLLHLCAELRKQYPIHLKAVHVHHGLSLNADAWTAHCATVCADLQIEFIQKAIDAKALIGDSPENVARERRYEVFGQLLEPHDILLTAHQQDDQAETVLVQLLRGAGPKGLAAMPSVKTFAAGLHGRPLLNISRTEIKKYAEANHLVWIEDESNINTNFTRNYLRHEVLPILQNRWPSVTKTLARVAENCAEAQELVANIAAQDLVQCRGDKKQTLVIKNLLLLDAARQRQVLRAWFDELGFILPSAIKLQQIQHDFLQARHDKLPYMSWGNVELRRYQDELYAMHCLPEHDSAQIYSWDLQQPLIIPGIGELQAKLIEGTGLRTDIKNISVLFRQGGERCYFEKSDCHKSLKHLFQEWQVPPWERDRIPLLFVEDVLVAVVGYFLDARYCAAPGMKVNYSRDDIYI